MSDSIQRQSHLWHKLYFRE